MSSLPKIKAIVLDWDDTITNKDTISLVAEAAYLTKPEFPQPWSHFSEVYYSNYKLYTSNWGERTTFKDELEFQKGLKQVELSSVNEYVGLQLFKDISTKSLEDQSSKVEIKPNFFQIFQKLYDNKIPIILLSCNWTSIIMDKIFKDHGFEQHEHFKIITNEFEVEQGILTGQVLENVSIRTGADKVEHVHKILQDLRKLGINDGVYYIGDSSTDVLPMLETDYGIVIGDGSATKTLQRLNINYDEGIKGDSKIKHIKNWNELNELV
ncbi:hypothetical protein BN7_3741 [Wickerhamomyces ciferrii]|uniref:Uncharacterized protein n=1 Tax=Wickerhamomyces ciferrii (strain ATCC 14091 / BCRC 22168 / CBS 111 / JCM 3599 / NBRC 0793 / NRRL Y-1031 F-60-10) TaxID=1206466 RepID=K0KPU3_WICCF|nr:uncharacterized protein BN7_3741 [Wickerhamomyces ciferrii]CCH44182.1 hypothetical protein BN7_3741 [Wickerhamomyces ciferrii]